MNYSEQYKHPNWQKKRLEILNRDNFTCQKCGDKETTLHIHHLIYYNNRKVWDYKNSDLVTLCKDCHELISNHKKLSKADFKKALILKVTTQNDMLASINGTLYLPDVYVDKKEHLLELRKFVNHALKYHKDG